MGVGLAHWVIKYRLWVLVVSVAAVALAATGIRWLTFESDYRVYFGDTNPQLRAFEQIQDTYTKYDNILFALAPKDGEVFSRPTLAAVEWLTEQAWQMPYSIRVDSVSNFQHTFARADDLVVTDLVSDVSSLDDRALRAIKEIALAEPLLRKRLVSEDARVTGVNVTVHTPGERRDVEPMEVANFARGLAERFRTRFPDIELHVTGVVMFNVAFPEATQHDLKTLVPVMFAVVMLTMILLTRSTTGTIGTVIVITFSVLSALGLAGWLGISLTGPSAVSPTIILTLAVADCVHFLANFVLAMRVGEPKKQVVIESLRLNLQPIFLTSLTTAIGFLSMNFSDAPPFRDLGNIVAIGVGAAFLLSVTFLPAFMLIMPVRTRPQQASPGGRQMEGFAEFVIRHRKRLLWGLGPVMLVLLAFIPRNELNDEFLKYFDESIEFRRASDFTTAHLTGIYSLHFSLESGESGGIARPDYLATVERFSQWLRAQPEVVHVNTLTDTIKRLNKNLHGDAPEWYRIPTQRELTAQYLLLYELSLPYGLDLNDQINVDKSATRLVVTTINMSSKQTIDLEARARAWLAEHGLPAMAGAQGSSPGMMFAHIGQRNIQSMIVGTTVALVLISMVLIVALRSVKIGLISLVPNLVPAALAFGLWGLLVGRVGLALSVVSAMSLGVIVDDTVHFLSKYMRARRERAMSSEDAVRYAFTTVGKALWITTLVLIAGFLVLAQSAFEVNSGMGLLTALILAIALFADFLFLPPLLMAVDTSAARDAGALPGMQRRWLWSRSSEQRSPGP